MGFALAFLMLSKVPLLFFDRKAMQCDAVSMILLFLIGPATLPYLFHSG